MPTRWSTALWLVLLLCASTRARAALPHEPTVSGPAAAQRERGRAAAPTSPADDRVSARSRVRGASATVDPEEDTARPHTFEEATGFGTSDSAPAPDGSGPDASGAKPPRRPALTPGVAREISAEDYARLFSQTPPPPSVATEWAWVGHSVALMIPAAGLVGAGLANPSARPVVATGVSALSGAVLAYIPAGLGYAYGNPTRPRWREVDVAIFGLSMVLTPPLAALGSFGSQSLFFERFEHPWRAYGAATAGALVGHLTGLILNDLLLRRLPLPELGGYRFLLGLSCVGIGAAFGQSLLGGPLR